MADKQQHEPKPWDMYRTPTGELYLISEIYKDGVKVIELPDGVKDWWKLEQIECDTFVGSVLALSGLVKVCTELAEDVVMDGDGFCRFCAADLLKEHPHDADCLISKARDSLALAAGQNQAQSDHAAACKIMGEQCPETSGSQR